MLKEICIYIYLASLLQASFKISLNFLNRNPRSEWEVPKKANKNIILNQNG